MHAAGMHKPVFQEEPMKPIAYLTAALVLLLSVAGAAVQEKAKPVESFLGVVKAVSPSSVTVERGTITGVFTVDSKTLVAVQGATAKTKEAKAAGKPGLTVPDAVHVGDQVMVKYRETNGSMLASNIQVRTLAPGRKK
jgi:hypothetical protein